MLKRLVSVYKYLYSIEAFNKYENNFKKISHEYKLTNKKPPNRSKQSLRISFFFSRLLNFANLKLFGVGGYDTKTSLVSQYLASPYIGFRRLLLWLIHKLDSIIPLPIGERMGCEAPRTINYGALQINTYTATDGIDKRCRMWKRSALTSIIETLLTINDIKNCKINFLEIGAASGVVSLFLAKWLKSKNISYEIICIEPNFDNVAFLEDSALRNKLNIKILPLAYGLKNKWIEFTNVGSKGLVGEKAQKYNNSENIDSLIIKKPMSEINFLSSYFGDPYFCYIDALLNEEMIIKDILEKNDDIKYFLIEFDNGLPDEIRNLFNNKNYKIQKKAGDNFLFSKI